MKASQAIKKTLPFWLTLLLLLGVTACTSGISNPSDPISGTQTAQAQLPSATPSSTPIPMAFTVDGEGYPLVMFQRELQRYLNVKESQSDNQVTETPETYVLSQLIDQMLLIRAAKTNGCNADDTRVQQDWDQWLAKLPEGQDAAGWLKENGYTEEEFRAAIAKSYLVQCQMENIASQVTDQAEQIHASQILVEDRALADGLLNDLNVGVEFATLAYQYDPLTGGDLGWFPPGYLLQPALNEAALNLQPGEHSQVLETPLGYHILYVSAREIHPLSLDARRFLQVQAIQNWLEAERAKSDIVTLLPQ